MSSQARVPGMASGLQSREATQVIGLQVGRAVHPIPGETGPIRAQRDVVVGEVLPPSRHAGERGSALAGSSRSAEQNAVAVPLNETGVDGLEAAIALPEQQLGVPRPAEIVLRQPLRIRNGSHDAPADAIESEQRRVPLQHDAMTVFGGMDDPGGAFLDRRLGGRRRDARVRNVPRFDDQLGFRRMPIQPEVGKRRRKQPPQLGADQSQRDDVAGDAVGGLVDAVGVFGRCALLSDLQGEGDLPDRASPTRWRGHGHAFKTAPIRKAGHRWPASADRAPGGLPSPCTC